MQRTSILLFAGLLSLSAFAAAQPTSITYRTYRYVCDGGQRLNVAYVRYGADGPTFAVFDYKGQQYGLAEALSASGARYASLYGPTPADGGLEWWTKGNTGTLSKFTSEGTRDTVPLLQNCVAP